MRYSWKIALIVFLFSIVGGIYFYIQSAYKIAIYSVYHKTYSVFKNDVVIPIQAGRALHTDEGLSLENVMIGDDTGINISEKNNEYCELTAMYWVWQNVKNLDVVGFMHYHRFFDNREHGKMCGEDKLCKLGLTQEQMNRFFPDKDIIIPIPFDMQMTGYEYYSQWHYKEDMDIAINYIRQHYPEMSEALDESLFDTHQRYFANMVIMKKEIFDEYAKWLFEILFAIEKDIGPMEGKTLTPEANHSVEYQRRAPGFLAERLFDVWIHHNRHKYKVLEFHTMTE